MEKEALGFLHTMAMVILSIWVYQVFVKGFIPTQIQSQIGI
jgi:hypothetical protein